VDTRRNGFADDKLERRGRYNFGFMTIDEPENTLLPGATHSQRNGALQWNHQRDTQFARP